MSRDDEDDRDLARTLLARATERWARGDLEGARRDLRRPVELFQALGDPQGEAIALLIRSALRRAGLDLSGSRADCERALELAVRTSDPFGQAQALELRAALAHDHGDLDAARRDHRRVLELSRELDDEEERSDLAYLRAGEARLQSDIDGGLLQCELAIALARQGGHLRREAETLELRAEMRHFKRDLDAASADAREAFDAYGRLDDPVGQARVLLILGELERDRGHVSAALDTYRRAADLVEPHDKAEHACALQAMGELFQHQLGRHDQAIECYRRMLEHDRSDPGSPLIAVALVDIARCHAERGEWDACRAAATEAVEAGHASGEWESQENACDLLRSLGVEGLPEPGSFRPQRRPPDPDAH